MQVRNPRNGKFDYELAVDDAATIQIKAKQLRKSQSTWVEKGIDYRSKVLLEFSTALETQSESLLKQLSIDTGRKK